MEDSTQIASGQSGTDKVAAAVATGFSGGAEVLGLNSSLKGGLESNSDDVNVHQIMNEFMNFDSSQRSFDSGPMPVSSPVAEDTMVEAPLTPRSRIRALLSGLEDANEDSEDDEREEANPLFLINQMREQIKAKKEIESALASKLVDVPDHIPEIGKQLDVSETSSANPGEKEQGLVDIDAYDASEENVGSSDDASTVSVSRTPTARSPPASTSQSVSEESSIAQNAVETSTIQPQDISANDDIVSETENSVAEVNRQLMSSPVFSVADNVPSGQGMSMSPEKDTVEPSQPQVESDDDEYLDSVIRRRRRPPVARSDADSDADSDSDSDSGHGHGHESPEKDLISDPEETLGDQVPNKKSLSKKEAEFAERETHRLKRAMNLAPEMHTTKFVSLDDFLQNFKGVKTRASGSDPSDEEQPMSNDEQEHVTPSTSPPKPTQALPFLATPERKPRNVSPEQFRTPLPGSSRKSHLKQTPRVTPRRLSSFVLHTKDDVNSNMSSSDSDLEIVPITKAATISSAHKKLVNLAQINGLKAAVSTNSPKSKNDQTSKPDNVPLMALLAQKQREQAMRQKEERRAQLQKLGIDASSEAILKEKEMVEDLLERERMKAEALSRKERPQERDILDDDEDDQDFNPDGPVPDVEFSGDESDIVEEELLSGLSSEEDNADIPATESDEGEPSQSEGLTADTDQTQRVSSYSALPDVTQKVLSQDIPTVEVHSSMVQPESPQHQHASVASGEDSRGEVIRARGRKLLAGDSDSEDEDIILSGEELTQASLGQFFAETQVADEDMTTPHTKLQMQRGSFSFHENGSAEFIDDSDDDVFVGTRPKTALVDTQGYGSSDESEDDTEETRSTRLDVEERDAARRARRLRQKAKKKAAKKAATGLFEEEAMESEDEWANVAGGSDAAAESDSDVEGYNLENLVDNETNEVVDQSKIQKLVMEEAREKDDEMIHKLMDDVTNGNWRKRRAAAGFLDETVLDMDDDNVEYMRQLQARAERKRQKLLEEERISEIVNNDKAKAFVESIVDGIKTEPSFIDITGDSGSENDNTDEEGSKEHHASQDTQPKDSSTKITTSTGAESVETVAKRPSKTMSIDAIRKSLSFLDEDIAIDITDDIYEQDQPLGNTSLGKQDSLISRATSFESDEDDDFVMLSSRQTVIDRKQSMQESIASKHTSSVDFDMPPPKLRASLSGSSTSLVSILQAEKLNTSKEVQIVQTLSGASAAGTKYQNAMARQSIKKHPARSALPRKSIASPSRTLRAHEKKKSAATPFFSTGSWA